MCENPLGYKNFQVETTTTTARPKPTTAMKTSALTTTTTKSTIMNSPKTTFIGCDAIEIKYRVFKKSATLGFV